MERGSSSFLLLFVAAGAVVEALRVSVASPTTTRSNKKALEYLLTRWRAAATCSSLESVLSFQQALGNKS